MPYNANVPLANQQISASQPIINANFQAILAAFNANHTDLLTSTGRHSFVQLVPQAPVPVFAGVPGFWSSTAAGNPIMLHTAAGVDTNISDRTFNTLTQGYCYLPSGLLVKFGRAVTDAAGHATVPTNVGVAYAQVPFVFLTGSYTGGGNSTFASVRGLTAIQLLVGLRDSGGLPISGPFQWMAIGI